MKIVRIRGGLGNQMFGYAFCQYLKRYGDEVRLDTSEFDCFQCHDGLEVEKIFEIREKRADNLKIAKLADYVPIPIGGRLGFKMFQAMLKYENDKIANKGKKDTHIFQDDFVKMSEDEIKKLFLQYKDTYFDGFWIDERYYDTIKPLEYFKFRPQFLDKYKEYLSNLDANNSCSIHIRRGDYVGSDFDVCNIDYYLKAIEFIKNKIPNSKFYVFSDDLVYTKLMLGNDEKFVYIDTKKEKTAGVDLMLMSKCRNNIIANSTFSFWGAKLNDNPDKIVIAPRFYNVKCDRKSMADKEWILI